MNDVGSLPLACPKCKGVLSSSPRDFVCSDCGRIYPVVDAIPDFTDEELAKDPMYKSIKNLEFLAPVYEGKAWTNLVLRSAGAKASSIDSIQGYILGAFRGLTGLFLDVACGPATHGRRLASADRYVIGVDFSMGTLRQGLKNIKRDRVENMRLVRAKAEELPFRNEAFDGLTSTGALHCFPDTPKALAEFARVLKRDAPVVVQTFIDGEAPLIRKMKRSSFKVFEVDQLREYARGARLVDFRYETDGCLINFSARKR